MIKIKARKGYAKKYAGVYQLLITDTLNGCYNNSFFGQIISDQNPPNLVLQNNLAALNCSYNTATLQALSQTPNTTVVWSAPSLSFTSSSPATTNQPGLYFAIATNTVNGCVKKDSVSLMLSNTLSLNSSNDTIICYGSSVTLSASPIGGSPPISYNWTGGINSGSATYNNNTTTIKYVVTINDNSNCTGTDTIKVTVPGLLNDSTLTFKGCDSLNPNGQIQVFGLGGIPPYLYSINNGASFQNSGVFSNLGFGTYQILIKDTLGCSRLTSATISPGSASPKVDFLVNSTLMQTDTFVLVDISNPRPDSIKWFFPVNIQNVNLTNQFSPVVVSNDTGTFYVKAVAYFGSCKDSLTKLVQFMKFDTLNTKTGVYRGIKSFSVYPNPNSGQFNVAIEFYKKQNFIIKICTSIGSEILQTLPYHTDSAIVPINMPVSAPGNYFIKVIAEFDSKQKSFIITN